MRQRFILVAVLVLAGWWAAVPGARAAEPVEIVLVLREPVSTSDLDKCFDPIAEITIQFGTVRGEKSCEATDGEHKVNTWQSIEGTYDVNSNTLEAIITRKATGVGPEKVYYEGEIPNLVENILEGQCQVYGVQLPRSLTDIVAAYWEAAKRPREEWPQGDVLSRLEHRIRLTGRCVGTIKWRIIGPGAESGPGEEYRGEHVFGGDSEGVYAGEEDISWTYAFIVREVRYDLSEIVDRDVVDSGVRFSGIAGEVEIMFPVGYTKDGEPVFDEDEEGWRVAKFDMPIPYGAMFRLGERSGIILSFPDMTTYQLTTKDNEARLINIRKPVGKNPILTILDNMILSVLYTTRYGTLPITYGQAVTGIKGTTVEFAGDPVRQIIRVHEGQAEVRSRITGETTVISAGQQIVVDWDGLGPVSSFEPAGEEITVPGLVSGSEAGRPTATVPPGGQIPREGIGERNGQPARPVSPEGQVPTGGGGSSGGQPVQPVPDGGSFPFLFALVILVAAGLVVGVIGMILIAIGLVVGRGRSRAG